MPYVGRLLFGIGIQGLGKTLGEVKKGVRATVKEIKHTVNAQMPKITASVGKHGKQASAAFAGPWYDLKPVMKLQIDKATSVLQAFEKRVGTLAKHIEHYLSFTIGVQLVMRSIRVMQQQYLVI